MTGVLLFARSRRWLVNLAIGLITCALIVACGPLSYALNPRDGYQVAIAAQLPLLPAISIQASLATSLRSREAQSVRSLTAWRFAHVILLTLAAAILAGVAATQIQPPPGAPLDAYEPLGSLALARNTLALIGAALMCAAITGPKFGWALPLAWAILPFVALPSVRSDPSGVFTLLMQPDDSFPSFVAAIAAWTIGAFLAAKDWNVKLLPEHASRLWLVQKHRWRRRTKNVDEPLNPVAVSRHRP